MQIENRGRGRLIDRKKDLAATMHGIKTNTINVTHYMRTKLIEQGLITEHKKEYDGPHRGRRGVELRLTKKGHALAALYAAQVKAGTASVSVAA